MNETATAEIIEKKRKNQHQTNTITLMMMMMTTTKKNASKNEESVSIPPLPSIVAASFYSASTIRSSGKMQV